MLQFSAYLKENNVHQVSQLTSGSASKVSAYSKKLPGSCEAKLGPSRQSLLFQILLPVLC